MESASGSDDGAVRARRSYLACVVLAVLLGLWLRWPSLEVGFFSDDFVQPAMRVGVYPGARHPLDLFNFAAGNPVDNASLMRHGALPWWAAPNVRLAMMRPLSSVLIMVDQALFGSDPLPYHVHSLVWWVLMMVTAAVLLRELFSPKVAGLAILLFALEEGHTMPLVWLANRGALVAMVFGLWGLLFHLRARSQQRPALLLGSFACFSIALLSGEWAFPLLGYVLAYELFAQQGPWRERLLSLWPAAVPGAIFLVLRAHYQYGALNSGVYIDPITEPAAFAIAALQRIPVFFADLFFAVPAVWWGMGTPWRAAVLSLDVIPPRIWVGLPGWHFWNVLIGLLAILVTILTLRAGLRDRPAEERRQIRWLLVGALVSLVPMVASFPTSRLVLPASVAACAAASIVLLHFHELARQRWSVDRRGAWLAAGIAVLVAYFQVWEPARISFRETRAMARVAPALREWVENAEIDDARVSEQSVFLLNSVEHSTTIFLPWLRWHAGHPIPRGTWVLSGALRAHDVYRPAPNVLEVSVIGGTMMQSDLERLYRADRFAIGLGERFESPEFTAEVIRIRTDKPQAVRFTFDKPIDDPSYSFLYSSPEGMLRARIPEIGQRFLFRKGAHPDSEVASVLRNDPEPASTCIGARPPLDECRVGYAYADCRAANGRIAANSGEDVFACHFAGDCRWFTGGCVAEGYMASPCRSRNLCCVDDWPFDAKTFPAEAPQSHMLGGLLGAYGTEPWPAVGDGAFDVIVDPSLPRVTPMLYCRGASEIPGTPCNLGRVDVAPPQQSSLRFAFLPPRFDGGFLLTVEVVDDRAGNLQARVCKVPSRPVPAYVGGAPKCPAPAKPICARSGTITLSRFPLELSRLPVFGARLSADFEDGMHVDAEL